MCETVQNVEVVRLNFLWTFPPRHWNNVETADFPPEV